MAINSEEALNAILNGTANSAPQNIKRPFKKSYCGISYDPEEHIYTQSHYTKQEFYKRVSNDDEFALYLNSPIYKTLYADSKHYFINLKTTQRYVYSYFQFTETLFDMSDSTNYVKLETPTPDSADGCYAILKYDVKYNLTKLEGEDKFKVEEYVEE